MIKPFILAAVLPSQCPCHFAEVRWIVGIEAALARRRLDGAIGRDEHEDGIENRVAITDPDAPLPEMRWAWRPVISGERGVPS